MSTRTDPVIDHVVDGRYEVGAELARGGMATVYRARDLRLDRPVALKVMRAELAHDAAFVRRFVHEARLAARLQHPHIVSVYDQGEDGDLVFLAMELVEGSTLRDVITGHAPLTARRSLSLITPVLEALAAAHHEGMVHRDVKPENVLIGGPRGTVKVADFGLARLDGSTTATSEMLWGTAAYLAPEQVEHGTADPRTDVYAVGLLLFELLTGRKAFPGDDPLRVAYEHVHGSVPHVRDLVPTVPPALEALLLRACATEPQDRPADAAELLGELRRVGASLGDDKLDAVPVPAQDPDERGAHRPTDTDADATQAVGFGGAGDTRRIPVPRATDQHYARTTGNRAPRPARQPRPPREHRRGGAVAWVLTLLLLLLGAGAAYGYWYLTDGPAVHSPMPVVEGLPEADARATLDAEDLDAAVRYDFSEEVTAGVVISADRQPGTSLRHSTDVELVVSRGPERYEVPRLDGMTVAEATAALAAENLLLGQVTPQHDEAVPEGRVVSASTAAGEPVPRDTPVDVTVSDGPAPVDVPDVTGRAEGEAVAALETAGLTVSVDPERVFDDTVPEGSVVRQAPTPGQVERGTTVRLTVSQGPELVTVPDVVARQFSTAERELTELGLVVVRDDIRGAFFGTVREQSLEPGTEVPKGTEIVLSVV
ncbi:Stk1 family PASTA domain-containing Ser/Thr kinase [Ornithinimicrobium sp. LYQ103]|uniref:Stk1 family PASTA domain-containing Ser/Thr kinase n=1 Tax=Ornithinimicrobium sp. LYQ103 TaxID=3378796 RepID=UPI0038554223